MRDRTLMAWAVERDLADELAAALRDIVAGRHELLAAEEVTGEDLRHFLFKQNQRWQDANDSLTEYDKIHPVMQAEERNEQD